MSSPIVCTKKNVYNLCNYTYFTNGKLSVRMYTGHRYDIFNYTRDTLYFSSNEEK